MKTKILSIITVIICTLNACQNKQSSIIKQNAPTYSFSIDTETTPFDLSTISDLDTIIPLETKDECLIGAIGNVFLTDSSIVVWDKNEGNIFVFDKTGKYVRKIGNKGGSPNEYISIGDVQMNKDTICILDVAARKIMKYDIAGKLISSSKSNYYMYTFFPVEDGCWGINMHQNENHYNLILLDQNLQKIKSGCFSSTEIPRLYPSNNFFLDEKKNELIFHSPYNDTIYVIEKDSIIPFIAIDFGKDRKIKDPDSETYIGRIHNVYLYGEHLFFSFNHSLGIEKPLTKYTCYISLKKKKATVFTFHIIHDNETIIMPLPEIVNISKGKLIYQIVPGEIGLSFVKETPYGTIDGDSNPILVLYNLKE